MDTDTTRETVVVTGFAPFRQYVVNPSWEAAKVVIHLGIAPGSKGITLEQTGKNYCYKDRDVSGLYPVHHCCIEGGPERLDSWAGKGCADPCASLRKPGKSRETGTTTPDHHPRSVTPARQLCTHNLRVKEKQ